MYKNTMVRSNEQQGDVVQWTPRTGGSMDPIFTAR